MRTLDDIVFEMLMKGFLVKVSKVTDDDLCFDRVELERLLRRDVK